MKKFFWLLVFVTAMSPSLWADGKVFPSKAFKIAPTIPSQRAIIAHRDGVEKLIIETAFEGEGKEFAWIIPLPNIPANCQETSAGLIKTLSQNLQPKIIHEGFLSLALFLSLFFTVVFLILTIFKKRSSRIAILSFIVFIVLLTGVLMPALGTVGFSKSGGASGISGLAIISHQDVGNYTVTVLKPQTSSSLNEWLEDNGFAVLSSDDETIVADYISRNWCFVASKLKRRGNDLSKPHPISITFPSKQPIYPMRLTSTAAPSMYLELLVVGEQPVGEKFLTTELKDQFYFTKKLEYFKDNAWLKGYKSRTYQNKIGHPQTKEFLWDGCWITKLVGTLTSEQMQRDIVLEWKNEESYRKKYFSHSGRWQMMGCVGLNVWWISLFVFASYFKWSKKIELGFNRWLAYILLYSVVLSAICMGITGKVIKPVAVREISFIDIIRQTRQDPLHGQVYALKEAFPAEQYESIVKMRDDVQDFLRFASLDNPFLTGPLVLEDSPGNFTIEDVDGKIAYFLYSRNAAKYQLSEIEEVSVDELFKKKYEDLDQSEHLHSLIEVISIPRPLSEISFLQVKVLVKLYKQRPLEQIPQILEYLTLLKQQNSNDKDAREVIKQKTANVLRMLACITHIEPPTDLQDQKAVDEFLKQIMDSTQTVS